MNKLLRLSILVVAFVVGHGLVSHSSLFASTPNPTFKITVPVQSLDLSDLDVRDAQNRRVKSFVARQNLRNLFASNLTKLLVLNLTPQKKYLLIKLSKTWDVFSDWWRRSTQSWVLATSVWASKKKSLKYVVQIFNSASNQTRKTNLKPRNETENSRFLAFLSTFLSSTILLR